MTGALALFGGSFDPPHVGHVLTACYALCLEDVDEVWIAPTFEHPFDKPLSSYSHRLRMCELAFARVKGAVVTPIERELGGKSHTLRLVETVTARQPGRPLRFVLGTDLLGDTHRWHRFDRISELAPPLIVNRGGHPHPDLPPDAPQMPEVSSTLVRERLAHGDAAEGLVPSDVAAYATHHGLYRRTR